MSTEASFEYNGPLSTYQEWDAAVYGVAVGLLFSLATVRRDIRAEPSKFLAGAILTAVALAWWR